MRISLILAIADTGVIGRDGAIPWRMSTDMKRFRTLTMGKPIVMGRKQYESVGKPLAGRDNIVLTRNTAFAASGVHVAASLDDALEQARACASARGTDEIMIIGGAEIYALALPRADRIYLSRVHGAVAGEVVFELGDLSGWHELERIVLGAGPGDEFAHTFVVLERTPRHA